MTSIQTPLAPAGPAAAPAKTRLAPLAIAPDTFVIHDHEGEGTEPMVVHLNAMVIRGEQPVVVDTGAPTNRRQYVDDLFSLVNPEDVRWVFLSHDDVDHYGNVEAVMDLCPQATLLTSWFMMKRLGGETFAVPPHRCRWLADGEPLDIGDRRIVAFQPPLYDSPTSRALFDASTGVYWGADCFAAPVLRPTAEAADLLLEEWQHGFTMFQQWNSPWVTDLERRRWEQTVDDFADLDVQAIASCHGPAIRAGGIADAVAALRALPDLPPTPQPGQEVLDAIVAAMCAAVAPA